MHSSKILHQILLTIGMLLLLSCETDKREKLKSCGIEFVSIRQKALSALNYCKAKGMNEQFCILVDLGQHSGCNRFVIWDFKRDTISLSCPVTHGCCDRPWKFQLSKEKAEFSNENGSHCSSLGKYSVGERGYSSWGIHIKYLLHGLENSNKNAQKRAIVFHSWEVVPDHEVYPKGTPEGYGCPAISNNNFKKVDSLLNDADKPSLLWIYT